jgi:protein-L-isoaspartate(D-aspartate) O-methyltransferase
MEDNYRLKGLRKKLIAELRNKGINDEATLQAFDDIPRHFFLPQEFAEWAYKNAPFKIDADQTISHPYTVAYMTSLLNVKRGDKILEIGTGSGYQACVLSYLHAKVYSIERQEKLFKKTSEFIYKLGFKDVRCFLGDGFLGLPKFAPFDKIIITAGSTSVPTKLLAQLKIGGTMILPKGNDYNYVMTVINRKSETEFVSESHGVFHFVPLLPGISA